MTNRKSVHFTVWLSLFALSILITILGSTYSFLVHRGKAENYLVSSHFLDPVHLDSLIPFSFFAFLINPLIWNIYFGLITFYSGLTPNRERALIFFSGFLLATVASWGLASYNYSREITNDLKVFVVSYSVFLGWADIIAYLLLSFTEFWQPYQKPINFRSFKV